MSKSVLLSIKPKYCELIASGKKTIEVRKTRPKIDVPFKGYIYCTKPSKKHQTICGCMILNSDELYRHPKQGIKYGDSIELMCCNDEYSEDNFLNGKVIGEFVCDNIIKFAADKKADNIKLSNMGLLSCLSSLELENYAGDKYYLYGFHISDLVIYDKPKELSDFCCYNCGVRHENGYPIPTHEIKRPFQSWGYVYEADT